jgi:hypothetical protein
MNIFYDFIKIIYAFFESLINIISVDFSALVNYFGYQISYMFSSWAFSFDPFGIYIPLLMVVSIAITIAGLFGIFMFVDAVKVVN